MTLTEEDCEIPSGLRRRRVRTGELWPTHRAKSRHKKRQTRLNKKKEQEK